MTQAAGAHYDAFISYNQRVDGKLAPAIQAGLHRFAKPWYRIRALRAFRDDASLSANPDLWGSIQAALSASDWFVVLASPEAARSEWVAREIGHWRTHRPLDRMLIVITDGEVAWDPESGDFDWSRTTAVPPALAGAFASEPRFIDMRWARTEDDVSLRNARFRDAVADVAASIHGRPKDELLGDDVRQHRRTLRLARGGVSVLVLLLVVAVVAALVAVRERDRAQEQALIATTRQLAAEAVNLSDSQYDLALLLAGQAHELRPGNATSNALLAVLAGNVHFAGFISSGSPTSTVAITETGEVFATGDSDGSVKVHDSASLETAISADAHDAPVATLMFSPDGDRLLSVAADGSVVLWPTGQQAGEPRTVRAGVNPPEPLRAGVGFSPDGDRMAVVFSDGELIEFDAEGQELSIASVEGVFTPRTVIYASDRLEVGDAGGRVITVRSGAPAEPDAPADADDRTRFVSFGQPLESAYASNGSLFAGVTLSGRIPYVTDAETGEEVNALQGPTVRVDAMAFAAGPSPDGLPLLATAGDNEVVLWDVGGGEAERRTITGFPGVPTSIAMDAGARRIVVASEVGVTVWDLARRSLVDEVDPVRSVPARDVPNALRGAVDVAFSPDGSHLAWILATPDTQEVVVFDAESLEEVQRISTPFVGVGVSFDGSGDIITVSGLEDDFAFDVGTGDERSPSGGRGAEAGDVETPSTLGEEKIVEHAATGRGATISAAGIVTVVDVERGVPVAEIEVPGAVEFSPLVFSPDGDRLAVASPGGTLDLVDLETTSWIETACGLAGRALTEEERDRFLGRLDPRDPCS